LSSLLANIQTFAKGLGKHAKSFGKTLALPKDKRLSMFANENIHS